MMPILEYDSNNSGGYWWLKDEHWHALEDAGWAVHWVERNYDDPLQPKHSSPGKRWLGALAGFAAKEFTSAREGIDEWERLTGQDAAAIGCNCCGPPHGFQFDGDYIGLEQPSTGRLLL